MTTAKLVKLVRLNQALLESSIEVQNEQVYVAASLAQSDLLRDYQFFEEEQPFSLKADQEVYTFEDYEWLEYALYIVDPILYVDPSFGKITNVDKTWADNDRNRVADGGEKVSPPKYFYTLRDDPISFGIYDTPEEDYEVKATIGVGTDESDDISESKPPIVPRIYDTLFLYSTIEKIFLLAGPKYAKEQQYFSGLVAQEGGKVKMSQLMRVPLFTKLSRTTWR